MTAIRWDDDGPWTQRQTRILGGGVLLGVVGLGLCWFFLSGEAAYQDQVPWLIAAIVCVLAVGVVMSYGLLLGFRAVHAGSRELSQVLRVEVRQNRLGRRAGAVARVGDTGYVTSSGMTRFHRPTCLLTRGKSVIAIEATDAAARGLKTCGACCR